MGNKRLQFETVIAAPVERVFATMIDNAGYREWTRPFCEGSYFRGEWREGQPIRFLSPSGSGMVSEIAELRPNAYISIRHLGFINDQGVEDTTSEAIRAWAPAYENYSFQAVPDGTLLRIDQDIADEYEAYMQRTWPQALSKLKAICEGA